MGEETPFYRALRLLAVFPRAYFRFAVEGACHVPVTGACVLAANHASYLDPIALAMACPRPVRFLVDRGQFRRPLVHWIAVRTGAIPVENAPSDLGSLRRTLLALRDGAVVGVFPEGGRSDDGGLKPARPGAALLALRAGVPLIPAAIVGAYEAYGRHHRFPRPLPIRVRFGPPLELPGAWRGAAAKAHAEDATRLLMERVAELLRLEEAPPTAPTGGALVR